MTFFNIKSQVPLVKTPSPVINPRDDAPEQCDPVDSLISSLSEKNPRFAALYQQASKDLAPLAYTAAGDVTVTSLRMAAGLTQIQFAKAIGQRQSNVSLLESGKRDNPNRETMRKMCIALGCDMNTLDQALENSKIMLDEHYKQQELDAQIAKEHFERKSA